MIYIHDCFPGAAVTETIIRRMRESHGRRYLYVASSIRTVAMVQGALSEDGGIPVCAPITDAYDGTISESLEQLIRKKRNIAATAASLLRTTNLVRQMISAAGYTLIVDQADGLFPSDVLESFGGLNEIFPAASGLSMPEGATPADGGIILPGSRQGGARSDVSSAGARIVLASCFRDVHLFTYLFDHSDIRSALLISNTEFEVARGLDGFSLCLPPGEPEDGGTELPPGHVPPQTGERDRLFFYGCEANPDARDLAGRIHVFADRKLNGIGDDRYALSSSWFDPNRDGYADRCSRVRKNLVNFQRNICKVPEMEFRWTTFRRVYDGIDRKELNGMHGSFRSLYDSSPDDGHRWCLAYLANLFPNPLESKLFSFYGHPFSADWYAMRMLAVWLSGTALARGEDIWLYMPSSRMRGILERWQNGEFAPDERSENA